MLSVSRDHAAPRGRPRLGGAGLWELSLENQFDHSALRYARNGDLPVRGPDCDLIDPDQLNAVLYGN